MAHVRKLIRDDVKTTLTGLATTGANVFQTRLFSLGENKLPAICIYTKSESTEYVTISRPRTQIRTLDVAVEFFVKATANVDNAIDAVALEIEEALYADPTRGGNAKDTKVADFEADYNSDGEQSVGVGRFTISVEYATLENDIESGV